jgi:hypothetical protein
MGIKVYIIYLIRRFFTGLPNISLSGSPNFFIPSQSISVLFNVQRYGYFLQRRYSLHIFLVK